MRQRLICQWVEFECHGAWGSRIWYVNGLRHRVDGGPAVEYAASGYCQWYERGVCVRNS